MFLAFAAAFLLNLLRPKFAHLLSEQQADTIVSLIEQIIPVLNEAAIDETHMPRSYAKFLSSLLDKHHLAQKGGIMGSQGPNSGVQDDPSVQGFLSQYPQWAHPQIAGQEGQGSYGIGPDIHITGPQDMLQPIRRTDTDSSTPSANRSNRHSDLWPPSFASFPDDRTEENGESVLRFPFEHGATWHMANIWKETDVRPPIPYPQL
jgi:hypothetical protein